jgi:hypothetical protein
MVQRLSRRFNPLQSDCSQEQEIHGAGMLASIEQCVPLWRQDRVISSHANASYSRLVLTRVLRTPTHPPTPVTTKALRGGRKTSAPHAPPTMFAQPPTLVKEQVISTVLSCYQPWHHIHYPLWNSHVSYRRSWQSTSSDYNTETPTQPAPLRLGRCIFIVR